MDIDIVLRYIRVSELVIRFKESGLMDSYSVIWSPLMQVEAERAAQRPAPELPVDKRGHVGNIGHISLPGQRNSVREDPKVTQLREDWLREGALQT